MTKYINNIIMIFMVGALIAQTTQLYCQENGGIADRLKQKANDVMNSLRQYKNDLREYKRCSAKGGCSQELLDRIHRLQKYIAAGAAGLAVTGITIFGVTKGYQKYKKGRTVPMSVETVNPLITAVKDYNITAVNDEISKGTYQLIDLQEALTVTNELEKTHKQTAIGSALENKIKDHLINAIKAQNMDTTFLALSTSFSFEPDMREVQKAINGLSDGGFKIEVQQALNESKKSFK